MSLLDFIKAKISIMLDTPVMLCLFFGFLFIIAGILFFILLPAIIILPESGITQDLKIILFIIVTVIGAILVIFGAIALYLATYFKRE